MELIKPGKPGNDAPNSVLFICGMNAIRSPIAAAITRALFPHIIYSRSAGIQKGDNDPFVRVVMEEMNVDISTHHPHTFEELEDSNFDLTITLTPEANDHVLAMLETNASDVEFWPMPDPTLETGTRAQRLEAYRALRDALTRRIKERFGWHS